YLDHHATTPADARVVAAMLPYFSDDFGNPASRTHIFGWRAEAAVEAARETLARCIGARNPSEIIFTSGATESDNLALKGLARAARERRDHVVTVSTEHRAILDPCRALEGEGFSVTVLPVGSDGRVDPDDVARAIGPRTAVVSVMAANNEIGTLQPLAEIGRICRERGVAFHSDGAQAVGKIAFDIEAAQLDLMSFCAHKIYGPKGVGALYVRARRPRVRLEPLQHGGGHERGLRSGTLPVPLIVGFAKAAELAALEREEEASRLTGLRERLWQRLQSGLEDLRRNGSPERGLPGNLNVCFAGVDAAHLMVALPELALSSGSACTSATPEPSHVLAALGLAPELVRSALRFGLGRGTTQEEIDFAAERVIQEVERLRSEGRRAPISARSALP
ncbi:MAG TPA: aminotransferase class V-fold PLP-dependent enzyme, partial [Myxococcota bacterium]|nr:aminotransferase class V-fold PLP-dependent enzyme [Myxococcota bacterium]